MIQRILIVIPCYNEESSLPGVLRQLRLLTLPEHFIFDVAVVDDCSTDKTAQIAKSFGVVVLELPVNLGIGGAVQTGFRYGYDNNYDYAIQMDGDGQHPASEISKLLDAIQQCNADIVIGSRFLNAAGFQSTYHRRLGIRYFKKLNYFLTGSTVHDSTSGFRCINRRALALVSEYYPDEYPEPEVLVFYSMKGLNTIEVPVCMEKRQGGVSSIGTISSFYYMFKVTIAILHTFLRLKLTR